MRTSQARGTALLLPILLLGLAGGPLPAQQAPAATAGGQQVATGDRTVAEGEVVEGIVQVGGDLRVLGEVTGDAVVVDGDLILGSTGSIQGDVVVTGGRFVDEGGRVQGEIRTIDIAVGRTREARAARTEATAAAATARDRAGAVRTPRAGARIGQDRSAFGPIRRGVAGIISISALGLVLAGMGALSVFFARPYLETVSDTARSSVLRAGATGLAATFLIVPAFVILIVALAVSIIGIPVLLAAVPLYPLAVFAAGVLGLIGAAHAIGERIAEETRSGLDLRYRNSYAYLFTGLALFLMPLVAAHLVSMTGFLGFIGTLLKVVSYTALWMVTTVGFGAVILSRAGTSRSFVTPPPRVLLDDGDLFGQEPLGRQGNA